ncbi:flippase-like domain-containing protein [Adhaeribacter swui]|uniref:Flippase-like domain-containing protein n=1 Tax=Adhaeribacter swui TaxID=2086471 RepID=A0A7G7G714_9BACT|nr:lysylphosphatidylglycerol synthase transmembrane domain-containing protein [Adhaeribacter swui]QNF32948.1 flippase-like domain-containing protein [Adhaeribacter swui]
MDLNRKKLLENFSTKRILIPVFIGLAVIGYMFYRNNNLADLENLKNAKPFWLVMTIVVLIVRDAGYIYRIRHITEKVLSWRKSLDVIMLWEFASCVLPSVAGGSTVAAFIINKEGIPLGKSLAYVMVTAMLDNMFFLVAVPVVLLATQGEVFPDVAALPESFKAGLEVAFTISYILIAFYATLMWYALFRNPKAVKRLFLRITSVGFLKKWRAAAYKHGTELVWASRQLKGYSFGYWFRACLSTVFVWTARYYVINCLIAAFTNIGFQDHMLIFSRNLIYKVVLLVAITPGGAGFAEIAFPTFFGKWLGSFTTVIVLLYRIVTYYLYLILGSIFLPRWVARVFGTNVKPEPEPELSAK